jgi:hypothetical protein
MMTTVDLLMHIAVAKDKIASSTRNAGQVAYHHRHLDKIAELALQQMKENMMTTTESTIKSTSDERTANNTMRHQYRVLNEREKELMQLIKDRGQELLVLCGDVCTLHPANAREIAIAKTKVEEAVMWAVKGLTK